MGLGCIKPNGVATNVRRSTRPRWNTFFKLIAWVLNVNINSNLFDFLAGMLGGGALAKIKETFSRSPNKSTG